MGTASDRGLWPLGIVFAVLAAAPSLRAQDLVIRRDGTRETGQLKACVADQCQLDERSIARMDIQWIGLAAALSSPSWSRAAAPPVTPPAAADPAADQIFLRDGTNRIAKLVGISADDVVTERGRWSRQDVLWIHLGSGPEATPSPIAGEERPQDGPSPPPALPTSPVPTPEPTEAAGRATPSPQPRPRPSSPVQACPPDRPLGGWIRLTSDYVHTRAEPCKGTQTLFVRFDLFAVPETQLPNATIALTYQARSLSYDIAYDGCRDLPGGYVCEAASKHLQGTTPLDPATLSFLQFFPMDPQMSFQLPMDLAQSLPLALRCTYPDGGYYDTIVEIGTHVLAVRPAPRCDEGAGCFEFCTPSTECFLTPDPQMLADCTLHPERFAVIPFEGRITNTYSEQAASGCQGPATNDISWKVCCGCGAAPGGAPP
jgi:hypothetical protein